MDLFAHIAPTYIQFVRPVATLILEKAEAQSGRFKVTKMIAAAPFLLALSTTLSSKASAELEKRRNEKKNRDARVEHEKV